VAKRKREKIEGIATNIGTLSAIVVSGVARKAKKEWKSQKKDWKAAKKQWNAGKKRKKR
jgi:hypothetical protein